VVCQTSAIFREVKEIDPGAFISMGSEMDVFGQGFEKLKRWLQKPFYFYFCGREFFRGLLKPHRILKSPVRSFLLLNQ